MNILSLSCSALRNSQVFFFVNTLNATSYPRHSVCFQSKKVLARGRKNPSVSSMAFQQREELDERARHGETVVPGGTGGKSLEAQEHLAEGRSRGGQTRKEQLGSEGYHELGLKGGQTRKEQMGREGYQEMGRKGGISTMDKSGGQRAAEEGIDIDESKFKNH